MQLFRTDPGIAKLLYLVDMKPKLELYEREKHFVKSRTIFSPNTCLQFMLMMFINVSKKSYMNHPAGAGDASVILGIDPVLWFKNFYNVGRKKLTKPTWFVYSDNIYAFVPDDQMWYSFDGSKMESCVNADVMTSMSAPWREALKPRVIDVNLSFSPRFGAMLFEWMKEPLE